MSDKERINKSKRERKNFGWLQDNTKSDDGSRENNRMMRQLTPNNIVDECNLQTILAIKNHVEMILCSGLDMECVCVYVWERE